MKKILLLKIIILLCLPAMACDVCGNGVSGFHIGTMPSLSKDFIGVRYRQSSFISHQGEGPLFETKEVFRTTELWYRKQLGNRWQVMTFVPVHFNEQQFQNGLANKKIAGLSDILLTGGYKLWSNNTTIKETNLVQQQLWLNAGLKLPVGKTGVIKNETGLENRSLQLGTGSTDVMLTALYTLRWNSTGLTADVSFRKNTENKEGYRFGDRFTSNLYLFYSKPLKGVKLIPLAGVSLEGSAQDREHSMSNYETGGYLFSATIGMNVSISKITAGIVWQTPIQQQLSKGHLKANNSGLLQFSYLFR